MTSYNEFIKSLAKIREFDLMMKKLDFTKSATLSKDV